MGGARRRTRPRVLSTWPGICGWWLHRSRGAMTQVGRGKARWLLTCSCGWGRECISRWPMMPWLLAVGIALTAQGCALSGYGYASSGLGSFAAPESSGARPCTKGITNQFRFQLDPLVTVEIRAGLSTRGRLDDRPTRGAERLGPQAVCGAPCFRRRNRPACVC